MSFHNESYLLHDHPHQGHGTTFRAGDVIRLFDGAFPDAAILGFDDEGNFKVARPYAYASSVGTTCASSLLGNEIITYPPETLRRCARVGDKRTT